MPEFAPFKPILDRILLRLVRESKPVQEGDVPDIRVSERYRQQTNKGEVLAIGDCVVLSGHKMPLSDFVAVGDHILFGQFTAEEFTADELFQQFKLTPDDQIYIVRVQDIRGSARRLLRSEIRSLPATCVGCGSEFEIGNSCLVDNKGRTFHDDIACTRAV
jgi:co-chaperonin GroES (HSP10)